MHDTTCERKSNTMPASTYTMDQITRALNTAADDVLDAADLPDTGVRDALNFLVNVVGARLENPAVSLADVARGYYGIGSPEIDRFQHLPPEERALQVVLGWIEE